jgi:2-succinyl-5-enolpyruvyl-6-hydroxy-3-cyclohexene-1-carboxylate synthase
MKIKVNRNILWAKIFIDQLAALGVKYACISPGFRSTPLTYVLSKNRKIKSFINIDERSSAFFALGLARATKQPVMIVTTSGTAVAELYPAIIEAYQQRTPLIICTADRPPELIGTGANQTINQHNIFKNHIRWFRDLGLPSISETGFHHLQKIAIEAYRISLFEDKNPVHLNFPFRKPLEPSAFTDEVNSSIVKIRSLKYSKHKSSEINNSYHTDKLIRRVTEEIINTPKGIILVGPMDNEPEVIRAIKKLSALINYPVFADGLSQMRFGAGKKDIDIISNFNSILKSENFVREHEPDVIIQFGRTPTSSVLESFLKETNANRYLINKYGDKFDPARNAKAILSFEPAAFCDQLISSINAKKFSKKNSDWMRDFNKAEVISESIKNRIIGNAKFPNEPVIITEILNRIPAGSNIFIGNSLPVRELDNFVSSTSKQLTIHFNRGASGIDGITSTALGISSAKKPTVLITGDLSFLHDLNALAIAVKYSIPLSIFVINNNGGGIFETLPIADKSERFKEYFITPHNLNFSEITEAFGIDYKLIRQKSNLQTFLKNISNRKTPIVFEVKTNAVKSVELRNKYFNDVRKKLNKEFSK